MYLLLFNQLLFWERETQQLLVNSSSHPCDTLLLCNRRTWSFLSLMTSSGEEEHTPTSNSTWTWRRKWSKWVKLWVSHSSLVLCHIGEWRWRHVNLLRCCCCQDRTLFSTYVLASGLQYGMGEQVFHFFFKVIFKDHVDCCFGQQWDSFLVSRNWKYHWNRVPLDSQQLKSKLYLFLTGTRWHLVLI